MTCPHLKFSIINKLNKKGNNNIFASLSYNSRSIVYEESTHRTHYPHTKNNDLVSSEMLLPAGAPAKFKDAATCFNSINNIEKGRIGYKLIVPFQKELSYAQNKKLIIELVTDKFVSQKHPVHIAIHSGDNGNYHAHVLVIDRRLDKGHWEQSKSSTIYYKRGTVKELDKNGKVINPDAELLTEDKKTDRTPVLKNKKLQYDKSGNVIYTRGWQELQLDKNGKPLLDKNGYPIVIDIREPDRGKSLTGPQKFSKNGKYKKPQWKKTTEKHSDISDYNNIKAIRQKWQELQNKYFAENEIKNEIGETLTVDLRSYAKQNEERSKDEQLIPTKHVFRPSKNKSLDAIYQQMIDDNKKAKENNNSIRAAQVAKHIKYNMLKLEKEINKHRNNIDAFDADDFDYIKSLNPRSTYISDYEKNRNSMLHRQKQFFAQYEKLLEDHITYNEEEYAKTNNTKRGKEKRYWLNRHKLSLQSLQYKLSHMIIPDLDVRKKAAAVYDKFTNKDIAAYIGKRFGESLIPLAAKFLESTQPDDSNPFNAKIEDAPYSPDSTTNTKLLKSSCKAIAGSTDFAKTQRKALSEWEQMPGQTPPSSVNDIMSIYLTASGFYDARLNDKKWTTTIFVKPSEHNGQLMNQQYEDALAKIAEQEKEDKLENQRIAAYKPSDEKQPEPQNAIPENPDDRTHDEHVLVHKNMGIERDKLFNTMIDLANPYANEDIRKIVYESGKNAGKPYRTKQTNRIKEIEETYHPPGLKDIIDDWENIRKEIDDYYKKYVNPQKPPADLSPDRSSSNRTKARGRK